VRRAHVVVIALAVALAYLARGSPASLVALATFVVASFERDRRGASPLLDRLLRVVPLALLAWVATSLALFLVELRPFVGGGDFFHYVLYARDLSQGHADVSKARWIYFPGVYDFWRVALAAGGGSLAGLQVATLASLVANGALVGGIVLRSTRSARAAVVGALLTIVLSLEAEGADGVTEPLATIPALLGLLVAGTDPFVGRAGHLRAAALGAGLGLALFTKQQAGLLALGVVPLVAHAPDRRAELRTFVTVVVSSLVVFAAGIASEGAGLEPVLAGLAFVRLNQREGSPLANVATTLLFSRSIALFLLATAVSVAAAVRTRASSRLVAFASAAALFSLVQLLARGYVHYLLIGLPFAVIALVASATELAKRLEDSALLRAAGLLATALLLTDLGIADSYRATPAFRPWPLGERHEARVHRWIDQPRTRADLERLAPLVHAGEDVVLIPPARNEVHFVLGTRARSFPAGYNWLTELGVTYDDVDWSRPDAVIVVKFDSMSGPASWQAWRCDEAVRALPGRGFTRVASLDVLEVWRRLPK
jgi:hypothetical protein